MDLVRTISEMITSHPDVFVLVEAPDNFYLPAFKKAKTPILTSYEFKTVDLDWLGAKGVMRNPTTRTWLILDPTAEQKYRPLVIGDLPPEEWLNIIHRVKAIVPPQFAKYEPYYMKQVVLGNLPLTKIEEDSERFNRTILLFIKFSRKAVWGEQPTDIHKFLDWRKLERLLLEFEETHIDYDASKDSKILCTKQYVNNVMSLLLGGPPEVTIYWFREVTTPEAASKYGKGTTWCTSSTPAARGTPEYDQHYANSYHKRSGLYIVEMHSPKNPRRPILQISGDDFMDVNDVPVSNLGPRLRDFFKTVLQTAAAQIHPETVNRMKYFVGTTPS